jgi:hypothetical protein
MSQLWRAPLRHGLGTISMLTMKLPLACRRLASGQWGAIARRQALAEGMSLRQIDRCMASNEWRIELPAIYALADFPRSWWQRAKAAGHGQARGAPCRAGRPLCCGPSRVSAESRLETMLARPFRTSSLPQPLAPAPNCVRRPRRQVLLRARSRPDERADPCPLVRPLRHLGRWSPAAAGNAGHRRKGFAPSRTQVADRPTWAFYHWNGG